MSEYLISLGNDQLNLNEVIEFVSKIFGPNYYEASIMQRQIIEHEPSTSPKNFIIARSNSGELLGVVRVVQRNILLEGVKVPVGGISSVGVRPEWRRRGLASELIHKAIQVMTSRGMDLSILYGRRAVDRFYTRFGYLGIGRYVDLQLLSYPESEISLHSIPFEREKQELCMKLYDESYQDLSGSVLRDKSVWDFLLMRIEKNMGGLRAFLILEGSSVVGYLVLMDYQLIEIAVPKYFFPAVPTLMHNLGIQSISIHPRHPFYVYCRTRINTIQKERFALDGGYMAKILNPQSLLKRLGPTLASRAKIVGASDQVIRLFDYEINLRSGEVSSTTEKNDIIFDRTDTAVQYLLGVISPRDVVGVHWTGEKPWIPYLFPGLHYHTSAWDEI
jgi:GNAT superfamily N-acetyltransferase